MVEIRHQNFYDFFQEHKHIPHDAHLLYRMQAFDNDEVSYHSSHMTLHH